MLCPGGAIDVEAGRWRRMIAVVGEVRAVSAGAGIVEARRADGRRLRRLGRLSRTGMMPLRYGRLYGELGSRMAFGFFSLEHAVSG
jgi:hypothetical protein